MIEAMYENTKARVVVLVGSGISNELQVYIGLRQSMYSCVVPASTYGLETLALSERHQHKLRDTIG